MLRFQNISWKRDVACFAPFLLGKKARCDCKCWFSRILETALITDFTRVSFFISGEVIQHANSLSECMFIL